MIPGFQQEPPQHQDAPNPKPNLNKALDIVFLQDTTGSQGPYIKAATQAIRDICDKISVASNISKDQIRFGLIAFRDHPPQDMTYVTKSFGFTSDVAKMQKNLFSLVASGGGDGPEAQTAALAAALDLEWAEDAMKMVVLITDAPPHGLGEAGDGFSVSPDQNDPLELARQMSEKGITLFVIACEPSLSRWKHAVDFYVALAKITSGHMFPLLMADKIGDFIVGTALETIETEKLISEFQQVIIKDVYNNDTPVHQVVSNLQEQIQSKGIQMSKVVMEDVYSPSSVAEQNVATWLMSKNVRAGGSNVASVVKPRLKAEYNMGGYQAGPYRVPGTAAPMYSGYPTGYSSAGAGFSGAGFSDADYIAAFEYFSDGVPPAPSKPHFSAAPAPSINIVQGPVDSAQAHRVVMQSMARNSEVTEEGMTSRDSGKAVDSPHIFYGLPGR